MVGRGGRRVVVDEKDRQRNERNGGKDEERGDACEAEYPGHDGPPAVFRS